MSTLKLFLLGPPRIKLNEVLVEIELRKAVALLAYVAVTRRSHSRDALSTLLWPDYDQSRARSYLRHTLWSLKNVLGAGWLEISREQVAPNPEADIWLDVRAFEEGLAAAEESETLTRLAEAAELYGDDFLSGFTLPDAPAFDEWQFFKTEGLRKKLAVALDQLVSGYSAQGDYEAALSHARRWVALDPLHEPAQRSLIKLYGESGHKAAALRQYKEYAALLDKELGVAPDKATTNLYETIGTRRNVAPGRAAEEDQAAPGSEIDRGGAMPPGLLPVPFTPPTFPGDLFSAEAEEVPFVGREQELTRLKIVLDEALTGQNRLAFVVGPAGQGKTTLMQGFAQQAQSVHPKLIVAGGNCNAYTGLGDPYLPFREILELLTGDIESRAVAGTLHPESARRLWSMLPLVVQALLAQGPDLGDTFISLQHLWQRAMTAYAAERPAWLTQLQNLAAHRKNRASHPDAPQGALFEQYTKFLQTLAGHAPLLLLLDDLQWADPGSVSLLFHLGRRLTGHRVLIVGAYRPDEVAVTEGGQPHPLAQVVHKFRRDFGDIILNLSQAEGQSFVDDLLDSEPNRLGPFFRQTLYRQTGGHPLFTTELLRGMQERGDLTRDELGVWHMQASLNWNTMPARVEGAIAERISRLAHPLREILQLASVEGEEFTAEVIAQVLHLDDHLVVRQLSRDLAKTHLLVRATGTKRVGAGRLSRYRFRHILIQRYLYNLFDEVERVYQHELVATTLESLYGEQAAEAAVQLARHFEAAQLPERAVGYLHLAGDQARRSAALNEAGRYYEAALNHWPPADKTGRAELLRKLGECQWMTGQAEDALKTFQADYDLFESLGNRQGAGAVQRLIGRVYWELGQRQESLSHYQRALSLLADGPESVELAWAISSISQMHLLASEYAQAIEWGERALTLAKRLDAEAVTVHALNNVGAARLLSGQADRGQAMLQESVRRALEANLPHDACRGRLNLGEGLASLDHYEEAAAIFDELHRYAARVGTTLYAGSSLVELAHLDWIRGRWSDSLARRQQIHEWLAQAKSQAYLDVIASILFARQHNDLGQADAAYQTLAGTMAKVQSFDELQLTAFHLAELARALLALGSMEEAIEVVHELISVIKRGEYNSRFGALPLLKVCYPLVRTGNPGLFQEVTAALQRLEGANRQFHSRAAVAALHEGQGFVVWPDKPRSAIEPLRQAVEIWRALGRPYDRIRALSSLGQALARTESRQVPALIEEAHPLIEALAAQLEDTTLRSSFLNSPLVQEIFTLQSRYPLL